MLPKLTAIWAKQYYFLSVGLPAPDDVSNSVGEEVIEVYKENLVKPVTYILYNDEISKPFSEDVSKVLAVLRTVKIPTIFHYLKDMIERGWYNNTGNLEEDIKKAAEALREECIEHYFIIKGGTVFKGFVDKNGKCLITLPYDIIDLGEVRRFKHGLNLDLLRDANPTLSNDFIINAVRKCVNAGILEESELTSTFCCVPSPDGIQTKLVTAMTPELPSFATRRLIRSLPDSYIKEFASPYHAAYQYALEHSEFKMCLTELESIVGNIDVNSESSELNDAVVIEYLHKKYGIANETLEALCVPVSEKLYSSTYFLDKDSQDMSVEEFIEKCASDNNFAQGSLDELIQAYCVSEEIDLNCTIEQLVKNMQDGTVIKPKSFQEIVKDYKDKLGSELLAETTVAEIIKGVPHKHVDNTDIAIEVIMNCDGFSPECKDKIKEVISDIEEKTTMHIPDLSEMLSSVGLPDDIITAIIVAEQTGKPVSLPEQKPVEKEVTEDDVVTYLVRNGVARAEAKDIVTGNLPKAPVVDVEMEVRKSLSDKGFTEKDIDSLLSGKKDLIEFAVDEPGYKAANSLLTDIRRSLTESDSDDLRTGLLPILYSYMRVLMMSSSDVEDTIDFLTNKKKDCSEVAAKFIDNAISKLKE